MVDAVTLARIVTLSRRGFLTVGLGALAAACGRAVHHDTAPRATATTRPRTPPATASPSASASAPASAAPALASEIVSGPPAAKAVALTFHGAGDPDLADRLLREAERARARVTVLAVGTWLADNPRMARRILDAGHELGNHTWRHLAMRHLDATAAYDEIARCRDELAKLTGSQQKWFRPSGTPHATQTIERAAARAGYAHCLAYDVDPLDYTDPGAASVRDATLRAVHGGSIVSLHLGHPGTVQALPAILDGLQQKGLAAVTVSSLLAV